MLHEGRFHQVKRLVAALGSKVVRLHREQVGGLRLPDDLAPGQTRELTPAELGLLTTTSAGLVPAAPPQ